MTRRVRKYAHSWKCPRVILMDEKMAMFYFTGRNIRNPFTRCLLSVTLSMGLVQCETIFYTQYDHL